MYSMRGVTETLQVIPILQYLVAIATFLVLLFIFYKPAREFLFTTKNIQDNESTISKIGVTALSKF